MLEYKTGSIFDSECEALVNTVNCVSVMGAGLAKAFKEKYPEMFKQYKKACSVGDVKIGQMWLYREINCEENRLIVNFPTKKDWRNPSQYEWIDLGLQNLVEVILQEKIKSIAVPQLGCCNGGLSWEKVRPMIVASLYDLWSADVKVEIYGPE